jgi:hypothetical protein
VFQHAWLLSGLSGGAHDTGLPSILPLCR